MKRHPAGPHSWPQIWLVTDARNDGRLAAILRRLPRGSGLIFRHYHLAGPERRARWEQLRRLCRARGHRAVLAGSAWQARQWGADGAYGPARLLASGPATLRLVTAHDMREIAGARRARATAVLLSPVHPTRSHPVAAGIGPLRFRALAARSAAPVIALGGMNPHRARHLRTAAWAAIDGIR